MAKLPNGDKAIVDVEKKLIGYCLNPEHKDKETGKLQGGHKAIVFEQVLGITQAHAEYLKDALLEAARDGEVSSIRNNSYEEGGVIKSVTNYEVIFKIKGINGVEADIISG